VVAAFRLCMACKGWQQQLTPALLEQEIREFQSGGAEENPAQA